MYRSIFLLAALLGLPGLGVGDDWVSSFFSNSVGHGSASFKSQQRGFYTAGGFSGRMQVKTEHPLSMSLPKLKIGCGGLDLFNGGMTFLDAEYLMQKMEGMLQSAALVAFDMALKEMCKECSETLGKVESIIDYLNNIQMNECAMGKRLVATVKAGDPNILQNLWGEMTGEERMKEEDKNWYQYSKEVNEDRVDPVKGGELTDISNCPKYFREVFKAGSLLKNVMLGRKIGSGDKDKKDIDMEDVSIVRVLRGFLGDVVIEVSENVPTARSIAPCRENSMASIEDMMVNEVYAMDDKYNCHVSKISIFTYAGTLLQAIGDNIERDKTLDVNQKNFIERTPSVPVYAILRKAVMKKTVEVEVVQMTEVVATAYVWHIFNTLMNNLGQAFVDVENAVAESGSRGKGESDEGDKSDKKCDVRAYAGVVSQFEGLHQRLKDNWQALRIAYNSALSQQVAMLKLKDIHEQEDRYMRKVWSQQHDK